MIKQLGTIAPLALLLLGGVADLASASFSSVHKSTFGGKEKVIVPNQAPDAVVTLTSPVVAAKTLTLNNCGWGKFTESATATVQDVKLAGSSVSISSGTAPTCVKAVAPATGYVDSNSAAAVGTGIKAANVIWVKGGSTVGSAVVDVSTNKLINAKANACGFASFTISPTRTLASFMFGPASFQAATMPSTANGGMICRKDSAGVGRVFVPQAGF